MNALTPIEQVIAPVSDRLCSDDLIAGPRTIKFTEVRAIEGERGKKQFRIRFEGDNGRPWYPCKTMARAMVLAWSITEEDQMVGRLVTVYRDPDVDFGDKKGIGGVRISHMSNLPSAAMMKLTVSQGKKGQFTFQPLAATQQAELFDVISAGEGIVAALKAATDKPGLTAAWKANARTLADIKAANGEAHAALVRLSQQIAADFDKAADLDRVSDDAA